MYMQYSIPNGTLAFRHIIKAPTYPTIIFLHDALGCSATWRDFPGQLAQQASCNYLVYDRLGHGESSPAPNTSKRDINYLEQEADILIEMIEKLAIHKPILFGHSDGGSIALIAASKMINTIRGIVVEAAHVFVENITLAGIAVVKKEYPNGKLRNKLFKYHGEKVDQLFRLWANTWLAGHYKNWNIESFLPDILCPCLIIQGEKDEYGSLRQVAAIEQGIPGQTKTAILQQTGHIPHHEQQDIVLSHTCDFIKRLKTDEKH
jgi:pimeloyl-ACP methyl ester carboxylesterase